MNIQTYAILRDKTESFPWTQFCSGDYSKRSVGKKKERINKLAKELFEREFFKLYPKETTEIILQHKQRTNNKINLEFSHLSWKTNAVNYALSFEEDLSNGGIVPRLSVQMQGSMKNMGNLPRTFYIDESQLNKFPDYKLTPESKDLLQKMVSYGEF